MPIGPVAIERVASAMNVPWRSASYVAGLLRGGSGGQLWVVAGRGVRAQVRPAHLIGLLFGVAGGASGTPVEAAETVRRFLALRRGGLTLTPEGEAVPAQVDAPKSEAAQIDEVLRPTLGETAATLRPGGS